MFLGAAGVLFAVAASWWWLAQHMAWWTFAALNAGSTIFWTGGSAALKEYRKSRKDKLDKARARAALDPQGLVAYRNWKRQ